MSILTGLSLSDLLHMFAQKNFDGSTLFASIFLFALFMIGIISMYKDIRAKKQYIEYLMQGDYEAYCVQIIHKDIFQANNKSKRYLYIEFNDKKILHRVLLNEYKNTEIGEMAIWVIDKDNPIKTHLYTRYALEEA